jgi:Tfp pilus assembly protein PilO
MNRMRGLWLELWWYWLPPVVILIVAIALLAVYRTDYAVRGRQLDRRVQAVRQQADQLRAQRRDLAAMRDARRRSAKAEQTFLSKRLGRRSDELTHVLREVKRLASRAGIRPSAIQYATDTNPAHGVEEVGLTFSVQGSYEQLRTFIHLLEVSDSFLILRDVRLGQANNAATRLRIRLRLATYFAAPPVRSNNAEAAG